MAETILDDVFLANAKFYYTTAAKTAAAASSESYIKIHGVLDVGEIGLVSEAKEKTNLEDTSMKYGAGMEDAPDKEFTGNVIPHQGADGPYLTEYNAQQTFIAACKAKTEMMIKIEYADGETDEFLFKPLGYKVSAPSSKEWKAFSVPGKQNSGVTTNAPI